MNQHRRYGKRARGLYRVLIIICVLALILAIIAFYFLSGDNSQSSVTQPPAIDSVSAINPDSIANGIHLRTGLVVADGYREVINNCTACHSASLVTQNRMDAKGWEATIRWMQETQNLWDLGESESVIIEYLVANYPVEKKGRRAPLKEIEWYALEDQ